MTRPGIEPQSPEPLANTLPIRPIKFAKPQLWYFAKSEILLKYMYVYVCLEKLMHKQFREPCVTLAKEIFNTF